MQIGVGNNEPIKIRPYRTHMKNRKSIDNTTDEMLYADVIRHYRPPWSYPVVIVNKKNVSKMFHVDSRRLNKINKKKLYIFFH